MADLRDDEVSALIKLYKNHDNLYNYNLNEYRDRDKAKESLIFIASAMGKGWTVDTTKTRLKWLRNGYTKNRGLIEKSNKRGAKCKVKWKWYQALDCFLRPYCKLNQPGFSNLTLELDCDEVSQHSEPSPIPDITFCDTSVHFQNQRQTSHSWQSDLEESPQSGDISTLTTSFPTSSTSNSGPPQFSSSQKKRKFSEIGKPSEAVTFLHDMVAHVKDSSDRQHNERRISSENEKFGLCVAALLDKLTPLNQIKTRKKINDILYEVQLEEVE